MRKCTFFAWQRLEQYNFCLIDASVEVVCFYLGLEGCEDELVTFCRIGNKFVGLGRGSKERVSVDEKIALEQYFMVEDCTTVML
jgi:hypothetical protein